jgi:hypothetical protein
LCEKQCGESWVVDVLGEDKVSLDWLHNEIEKCLNTNLRYAALTLSLSIPDICSNVEELGGKNAERYSIWFDRYAAKFFNILNGQACWQIRCALLHSGNLRDKRFTSGRVIFSEFPKPKIRDLHLGANTDLPIHNIDLQHFCTSMVEASKNWDVESSLNLKIQNNLENLIEFRPDGFPPYVFGAPIIG